MSDIQLSIVLPAYREAENLRQILPRLKRAAMELSDRFEIIVVDTTEAMDDTSAVCAREQVTYVARQPTNSYGDAIRSGIRSARGRYVVMMDADGSHPPEFLSQLNPHAATHDVVIASRYVRGGHTENALLLVLMSRVLNAVYSVVLGIPCTDVSNSFRLYRGDTLRALSLKCANFDIVEEILVKMVRRREGVRIKEVPFTFRRRSAGKTKRNLLLFIVSFLVTLFRLRFKVMPALPAEPVPSSPADGRQVERTCDRPVVILRKAA